MDVNSLAALVPGRGAAAVPGTWRERSRNIVLRSIELGERAADTVTAVSDLRCNDADVVQMCMGAFISAARGDPPSFAVQRLGQTRSQAVRGKDPGGGRVIPPVMREERRRNHARRVAVVLLVLCLQAGLAATPDRSAAAPAPDRPFGLPFAMPPGPDTWLLGQTYGNTTGAYRQRRATYAAGQGIHFGTDLSAPCGTEVVAMADGVVFAVDALSFGSAPHNLMIDHPDLGYATFYGHLLERPALRSGAIVTRGQVVARTGDPESDCDSRPHLHLEIRDLRHARKYNPVVLVEADWDSLSLIGPFSRGFERDLDDPRRWQHLDDQPESVIGGPLLNDFARPWPPDRR
jgi:murein DD-endopeptidase MepM/ murein hydrolase activator NlpD